MNSTRQQELWVGIFVVIGIVAFAFLAFRASDFSGYKSGETYTVYVNFENIGGLKSRSPVTMSGVKIGQVDSISYDPEALNARVALAIESQYDYLPEDSQASIYTAGLLGENYIALEPGAEDATLVEGDVVQFTQSALVLEELIGQFLVNMASSDK